MKLIKRSLTIHSDLFYFLNILSIKIAQVLFGSERLNLEFRLASRWRLSHDWRHDLLLERSLRLTHNSSLATDVDGGGRCAAAIGRALGGSLSRRDVISSCVDLVHEDSLHVHGPTLIHDILHATRRQSLVGNLRQLALNWPWRLLWLLAYSCSHLPRILSRFEDRLQLRRASLPEIIELVSIWSHLRVLLVKRLLRNLRDLALVKVAFLIDGAHTKLLRWIVILKRGRRTECLNVWSCAVGSQNLRRWPDRGSLSFG